MNLKTKYSIGDQCFYMDDDGRVWLATIEDLKVFLGKTGIQRVTYGTVELRGTSPYHRSLSEEQLFKTETSLYQAAKTRQHNPESYTS